MQDAITATVAVAGLFFSLMCGLLLEELVFGSLFHLLRPVRNRGPQRPPILRVPGGSRRAPQWSPEEDLFGTSEK
jgi:hypothetical protein